MDRRQLLRCLAGVVGAVATGSCTGRGDGEPALDIEPVSEPPPVTSDPAASPPRTPEQPPLEERTATPAAAAARPVVCRADWAASAPTGPYRRHTIERLTVHHTAVVNDDPSREPDLLRQHQRNHQARGFVDLAYHLMIARDGTVYEGRAVTAVGETFTDYDPAGHFLPCLEGNFDRQEPSDAQLAALADVLAWAAVTFGVPPETIRGHRSYAATRCPGDALQRVVDDGSLERWVTERIAAGGARLELTCGGALTVT
ncbi:MAG: peptidoglycan recognition protein family protein [Actinobacteria bacterium]|nr:peptidoglycan recognition protein family protein [Actinomycetota bacterium]